MNDHVGEVAKALRRAARAGTLLVDPDKIYPKERERVYCDGGCEAFDEPNRRSLVELRDAYEHWRKHEHLDGCSHGR